MDPIGPKSLSVHLMAAGNLLKAEARDGAFLLARGHREAVGCLIHDLAHRLKEVTPMGATEFDDLRLVLEVTAKTVTRI